MKDQSPKTVETRQKDQWVSHNSPKVKLKQKMAQRKFLMAHLKITSLWKFGSKGGRKGRCLGYEFGPYVKECPNDKDVGHQRQWSMLP